MAAKTPKFKFEAEKLARALPVMTGVVALGYLLGAYVFFFMPKLGRLVPYGQLDIAPFTAAVETEKAYQRTLKEQIDIFNKINVAKREKAMSLIPPEPDFPGLLVQISELCAMHQASCPSIDMVSDDTFLTGGRKSVRLSLNVAGLSYDAMKSFLSDIERSQRLFDAESVIYSPSGESMTVSLRAYYLTDEVPTVAPVAAAPVTP